MDKKLKIVAILLSFLRPFNIQRICSTILELDNVDRLILSNNNPEIDIRQFISINDPRFILIEQDHKENCFKRFEIAAEFSSAYYLAIDDDLFLKKHQILSLLEILIDNPDAPVGFWGQQIFTSKDEIEFSGAIFNQNRQVDILNRLYFFRENHLQELFSLVKQTGLTGTDIGSCDDLFISFSGKAKPLIHYIGDFEDCVTSNQYPIAEWTKKDFFYKRKYILSELLKVKNFNY